MFFKHEINKPLRKYRLQLSLKEFNKYIKITKRVHSEIFIIYIVFLYILWQSLVCTDLSLKLYHILDLHLTILCHYWYC